MLPRFEETVDLGPTLERQVLDANELWRNIVGKCEVPSTIAPENIPEVVEQSLKELELHAWNLHERLTELDSRSTSIFFRVVKVKLLLANKVYEDEIIRCRYLLDSVSERISNRSTRGENMDTYCEKPDMNNSDGIEMGTLISTSSPIEGNSESTGVVAEKVGNEQVDSFVGNEDSSNEVLAEVGEKQQGPSQQQLLLNSEGVNNLVSADDSSIAVDKWSSTGPLTELKRDLVTIHSDLQRDIAFKMQNYNVCKRLCVLQAQYMGKGIQFEKDLLAHIMCSCKLFTDSMIAALCEEAEMLYASLFAHGDCAVARVSLNLKSGPSLSRWRKDEFWWGIAVVLVSWVSWDCLVDKSFVDDGIWQDSAIVIFRGVGNLVLLVWLFGLHMWIWRKYEVDSKRCLDVEQRHRRSKRRSRNVGGWGGGGGHRASSSSIIRNFEEYLLTGPLGYMDGPTEQTDPVQAAWSLGCELSIVWLTTFLVFYKGSCAAYLVPNIIPLQLLHAFPALLLVYTLHRLLFPWFQKGRPLLIAICRVIAAPLIPSCFLDSYVGDYLTSAARLLVDLGFSFLYVMAGTRGWLSGTTLNRVEVGGASFFYGWISPVITVAPLWWRLLNTLRSVKDDGHWYPNLGNSLKYACAIIISTHGPIQPGVQRGWLWIFAFIAVTLYQLFWDIFMDWDLLRFEEWSAYYSKGRPRAKNLPCGVDIRPMRAFPKWIYYVAILLDTVLRFLWTASIIPEYNGGLVTNQFQHYRSSCVSAGELIRRSMWGVIRMENEYVRICHIEGSQPQAADGDNLPDGPFTKMDISSS